MMRWLVMLWLLVAGAALADTAPPAVAQRSAVLPEAPLRIVTLDDVTTELAVSLGLEPVGVANLAGYRRWVKLGNERLDNSQPLGSPQQPDLERIIQLRPDLILGNSSLHGALFERLDALAPTLLYRVSLAPSSRDAVTAGEDMLRHLARLTGRQAQAEAVLAGMHGAIAQARATAQAAGVGDQPLAVLYPLIQQGLFIVSNEQTLVVSLANRLGGSNPWPLRESRTLHQRIDFHALARRPDLNLLFIGGFEGAPFFRSAVWQALPVAERGRYGFLATPYWSYGGPWSATVMVRQMAEALEDMGRR